MWPESKSLLPFSTIDQNGEEFGLQNLQGKWSFYFLAIHIARIFVRLHSLYSMMSTRNYGQISIKPMFK